MSDFWLGFLACWCLGWLCGVMGMLGANSDSLYPLPAKFMLTGCFLLAFLWPLALVRGVQKMMGVEYESKRRDAAGSRLF